MSVNNITCNCGEIIYKSSGPSKSKIRNRIVLIEEGLVKALCKSCGKKIDLPLKVDPVYYPPLYVRDLTEKK